MNSRMAVGIAARIIRNNKVAGLHIQRVYWRHRTLVPTQGRLS